MSTDTFACARVLSRARWSTHGPRPWLPRTGNHHPRAQRDQVRAQVGGDVPGEPGFGVAARGPGPGGVAAFPLPAVPDLAVEERRAGEVTPWTGSIPMILPASGARPGAVACPVLACPVLAAAGGLPDAGGGPRRRQRGRAPPRPRTRPGHGGGRGGTCGGRFPRASSFHHRRPGNAVGRERCTLPAWASRVRCWSTPRANRLTCCASRRHPILPQSGALVAATHRDAGPGHTTNGWLATTSTRRSRGPSTRAAFRHRHPVRHGRDGRLPLSAACLGPRARRRAAGSCSGCTASWTGSVTPSGGTASCYAGSSSIRPRFRGHRPPAAVRGAVLGRWAARPPAARQAHPVPVPFGPSMSEAACTR